MPLGEQTAIGGEMAEPRGCGIAYRLVCLSGEAAGDSGGGEAADGASVAGYRLVELPEGLPARSWKRVEASLAAVLSADAGDLRFHRLVRTSGGFAASEANGLVPDFKLDPRRWRGRPEVWRRKEAAVEGFAGAVARLLERDDFRGAIELFGGAAVAPVPTRLPKSHEFHDPRLSDLCALAAKRVEGVWLEDAFDMAREVEPAHLGGARDAGALARDVVFSGFARPPRLVILVDDVLTSGSHFAACRDMIRERCPGVTVFVVFLAIHKSGFVEYPVSL